MSSRDPIRISPGDVIDDFEIVEAVATGGSSTTFRALHRTLAREVSLKYVHPAAFDDGSAMEAARADATRVARLEHPGIAPVFAAGLHEGGLYIASAMPKGRTLAELGADRAITPADTARVLTDVAAALEVAHAQGVVHRDLRPECITVDRWGHGVVRDFGVTRTSGRTGLLTRAEVLESLRYTAPELVLGRPATPAADVYELAALAVWCLTGAPPYHDRPPAEYVVFRACAPPPVLAQADGTPAAAINELLTAAMSVEPAERPAPAEFAFALDAAIARLAPAVRDAGCPLTAAETSAAAPAPLPAQTAAAMPIAGDTTRAEHRRPLPAAAGDAAVPTPWSTYAACGMAAFTVGLGGLFAGRASAPEPPAPIRVGAFTLDAGDTWRRAVGTGDSRLAGASLAGATGETATVGVVTDKRLPGDPVPPGLLSRRNAQPRAVRSGGVALVRYTGAGDTVLARPTSRGTVVALCSRAIAIGRCAALLVHAEGPGRTLAVVPAAAVADGLREGMKAIEQATGIASAEMQGDATAQAGAAARLATALREAATGLQVDGVDPGTGALLDGLRNALGDEAGALEALGSAIDRKSDVAFDAATEIVRASRRKIEAALVAFRRAGYPVNR